MFMSFICPASDRNMVQREFNIHEHFLRVSAAAMLNKVCHTEALLVPLF